MMTTQQCLCYLEDVITIFDRKWAIRIISLLGNKGELTFNQILRELQDLTPRSLSETLKELERKGLVEKEVKLEPPIRVYYKLSPEGKKFRDSLIPVLEWVITKYGENLVKNTCCKNKRIR